MADTFIKPTTAHDSQERLSREKTGVLGQDTRLINDRGNHISYGNMINYYDDLGINTTAEKAQTLRTADKEYKTKIDEATAALNKQEALIDANFQEGTSLIKGASSEVGNTEGLIQKAWGQYQETLVPIRVVNGNTVEQTYYLPPEVAEGLATLN